SPAVSTTVEDSGQARSISTMPETCAGPAATIWSGTASIAAILREARDACREDVRDLLELFDLLLRDRVIDPDRHERAPADSGAADAHEADVDVVLAEEGADGADHAGAILVLAEQEPAIAGRDVHPEVVDGDDVRAIVRDGARDVRIPRARVDVHADQVGVDLLGGTLALGDAHAAVLGDEVRIHDRDVLVGDGRDKALDDGGLERGGVVGGDLAEVLDLDVAHLSGGELGRQAGDLFGDGDVGRDDGHGLGGDHRRVDGVLRGLAAEDREDLPGDIDGDALLCLGGGGAEMRGDDDLRVTEHGLRPERVAVAPRPAFRLVRKDVERGAGDVAGIDRAHERVVVDELAAGGVDDAQARLRGGHLALADHVPRLRGERGVQRQEVRALDDGGDAIGELDAEHGGALGRDERVVGDDAHVEPFAAARDLRANLAEADDAQRLAAQLDADEAGAVPLAGPERGIGVRDVAREREHERDGVLGGGDRVPERRIDDDHAALGRRGEVDIVDADAGTADDVQLLRCREDLARHLRLAAHDERLVGTDGGDQVLGGQAGADVDLGLAAQEGDAVFGDRVGDEDLVHVAPFDEEGQPAGAALRCDTNVSPDQPAVAPTPEGEKPTRGRAWRRASRQAWMSASETRPRWPMRKILPVSAPWPPASTVLYSVRIILPSADHSTPSGTRTAVTVLEATRSSASSFRPSALTPSRVNWPIRAWRAWM